MSTSDPSPQSAAERRSAEAELRTLITKFAPEHLRLVEAARRTLQKRLPTANEIVYEYRSWFVLSYSPTEQGSEGVLAIRGDADGVKLYFSHGKDLPDPEKLLRGSAQVRSVDLEGPSTLTRPAVMALMEEAIARNKVPFPGDTGGRAGAMIMRTTKTKPATKAATKAKTKAPSKPRPAPAKARSTTPKARPASPKKRSPRRSA